jgi:hypothetical protein
MDRGTRSVEAFACRKPLRKSGHSILTLVAVENDATTKIIPHADARILLQGSNVIGMLGCDVRFMREREKRLTPIPLSIAEILLYESACIHFLREPGGPKRFALPRCATITAALPNVCEIAPVSS